jgi:hypothetical protein
VISSKTNVFERFYSISTYCRVKEYTDRSVKLEGLNRCKIEDIEMMELLKATNMTADLKEGRVVEE